MTRPFVQLKFASSLDGCIDDTSPERRVFSSPEDRAAVYALRAEFDAILIGAETLRRDKPKLMLENAEGKQPTRIIVTNSGDIPADVPLFKEGSGERIIYTTKSAEPKVKKLGLPAKLRAIGNEAVDLPALLEDLSKLGVKRLLVEGGAKVLGEFLELGLFDRLRMAIAPEVMADGKAPKVAPPKTGAELILKSSKALGGMVILDFERA